MKLSSFNFQRTQDYKTEWNTDSNKKHLVTDINRYI